MKTTQKGLVGVAAVALLVEAARLMPDRVVALIPVDFFNEVDRRITAKQRQGFLAPMRADFPKTTAKPPLRLINSDLWPTDLEALRRHNPKIGLAVVPGVGHFLMMEAPEEFNRILGRAVSELPRR